jgi:hypothetical protein
MEATSKANLESLKAFVATVSGKYPEKLPSILICVEKHYLQNKKLVDDVMQVNGPKGGFSILTTNVPEFKTELLALR